MKDNEQTFIDKKNRISPAQNFIYVRRVQLFFSVFTLVIALVAAFVCYAMILQHRAPEGYCILLLTVLLSGLCGGFESSVIATTTAFCCLNILLLNAGVRPGSTRFMEQGIYLFIALLLCIILFRLQESAKKRKLLHFKLMSAMYLRERRKNDMIQIAIHELKSPLELASDYIQLTMNNMKVDDNLNGQQFLKQANIHVRKANSFVADTKDAALFESEEIQFRFDHFDIKACLSEIVSIFRQTFGDYQFIMNTLEQPVIIYGDEARISRVITNFIANAIKYSSGQKTIEISIVNAEPEIQIDVKDYGIGITKDEHEKIFKKNDGIHADGKQHHTGHGLYIASKIMLRHLGKIGVKNSSPGNGSTFWIKLPQVKELIF